MSVGQGCQRWDLVARRTWWADQPPQPGALGASAAQPGVVWVSCPARLRRRAPGQVCGSAVGPGYGVRASVGAFSSAQARARREPWVVAPCAAGEGRRGAGGRGGGGGLR